jgi:hypothetical protein
MIVGSYVLHLYCDCVDCAQDREMTPKEISEPSEKRALARARKLGWRFNRDKTLAYAPNHPRP